MNKIPISIKINNTQAHYNTGYNKGTLISKCILEDALNLLENSLVLLNHELNRDMKKNIENDFNKGYHKSIEKEIFKVKKVILYLKSEDI